ncbi:MAG: sigma 54-interacting transcriptional regulator [Candidatus Latescibacterota bacterium]
MQWIKTALREVSSTDLPVLIQGQPGTGRRLAARTIHFLGQRQSCPFVEVNCSALPPPEAGQHLFGGSGNGDPGAPLAAEAALAVAAGGTLFLEDVDALPLEVQERLAEFLRQQRDVQLDEAGPGAADVRFIGATHAPLERMARAGSFSSELYYRLSVATVRLPPLGHHKQDIPWLAQYFVRHCAALMGRTAPALGDEALAVLLRQDWPGNTWQLKRLLEQAVVLAGEGEITAPQLERLLRPG